MTEEEPVFADKEEAWEYYATKQKERYEKMSEEDLMRQVEAGNYDLFFTLPDVVAKKLPREKALLTLFKRVMIPSDDMLVSYHTLNNLMMLLGNKDHDYSDPPESLFNRINTQARGEQARLDACKELWELMNRKYDVNRIDPLYYPNFIFDSKKEFFQFEYKFNYNTWKVYFQDAALNIELFENKLRESFDEFRTYGFFTEKASLNFVEETLKGKRYKVARITGFQFAYEIRIFFGVFCDSPVISQDESKGGWFINNPLFLQLIGEKNYDLEERITDVIMDPLGIFDFGFDKYL